jgi:hypothetical protein
MRTRLGLLSCLLLAGCAVDSQVTLKSPPLLPVALEKPRVKFTFQAPDDAKVNVRFICRGSRGGVLLAELANTGEKPLEFRPRQIGVQLSSGYHHRFMSASEFKKMCDDFGAASYGIGENDLATVEQWRFAEEDAKFVLKPGEIKEIPLPFGAQPEEAYLTLDFDAALKRAKGVQPAGRLLVAVELPQVLAPKKDGWPAWLHFGFAFTNAA